MIVTRLKGGLGNQMFQYAVGRRVSLVNKVPLKLNLSLYPEYGERKFGLDNFNIQATIATGEEIRRFHTIDIETIIRKFLPYYRKKIVYEKGPFFDPNILNIRRKRLYIVGHWEAEGYFKDVAQIIRKDFTLKKPLASEYKKIVEKMGKSNSVSLHIRRGDQLTEKYQKGNKVVLPQSYFREGLAYISTKVKKPIIFISSDDIGWVKDNFKIDFPVIYLSEPKLLDYEELILMSYCKNNIIPDSSFSWWAAWLNTNPDKIVIAPANWRKDPQENEKYTAGLIPDDWIKIAA